MRIIRHQSYISQRKKHARIFALLGFLLLSGSLLIAWYPEFLIFAYVAMLGGFILFNMGMQQVGKWTRNPRNDQLLDHHMRALSDRVTIIHYAQIGKRNIEHIVVHQGGVAVLTAREVDGTIQKRGSSWGRKGGLFRRLFSFSGPQLGNPSFETDANVSRLLEFLTQNGFDVHVEGAIVFVHPKTELDIRDPDYPVLHGDEVDEFINDLPVDESFSREDRDRIVELLSAGEEVETPQLRRQGSRRPRPVKRVTAPKARVKTS